MSLKHDGMHMATRDEAIQTLALLKETYVLQPDMSAMLNDIISCIRAEESGYHIWGADIVECRMLLRPQMNMPGCETESVRKKHTFITA